MNGVVRGGSDEYQYRGEIATLDVLAGVTVYIDDDPATVTD